MLASDGPTPCFTSQHAHARTLRYFMRALCGMGCCTPVTAPRTAGDYAGSPPLGSNTWRQSSNTCRPLCRALLAVPAGIWLGVSLFPCDRALPFTAVAMPLHCRSLMFTAFVLLCFSCASAAFVAKTLPLSCAFTAFVAKTLPLVVKLLVFLR